MARSGRAAKSDAQIRGHPGENPLAPRHAVAVGLAVAAARLGLVAAWGGGGPYLDECSQTGWTQIFAGEGGVPASWMWGGFMEHRLVTQRAFTLGLAAINGGQWDVRVELMAAALVWGALAGLAAAAGWTMLAGWRRAAWGALVGAAFVIPHAWENLLWAFQVQFGFAVVFGLGALWLLATARAFSPRWWLGIVAGALCTLSQATGALVWPAAAVVAAAGARADRKRGWTAITGAVVPVVLGAVAFVAVPHVATHTALRPESPAVFFQALGRLGAWPWTGWWWAPVLWAPGVAWLWTRRVKDLVQRGDRLLLGLITWAALSVGAAAVARGDLLALDVPPSRYGDVLLVGLLANGLALLAWSGAPVSAPRLRSWVAAAWLVAVVAGLGVCTLRLLDRPTRANQIASYSMREFIRSRGPQETAYIAYIRTGDPATLRTEPPIYPVAEHLAEIVDRLRACGRWPAVLEPDAGRPVPRLSRLAARPAWVAMALLAVAGALAAAPFVRGRDRAVRLPAGRKESR